MKKIQLYCFLSSVILITQAVTAQIIKRPSGIANRPLPTQTPPPVVLKDEKSSPVINRGSADKAANSGPKVNLDLRSFPKKLGDGTTMNIRGISGADNIGNDRKMDDTKRGTKPTEQDNSDNQLCTVEYKNLSIKSMDQDVMDENTISNLKLGGAFSLTDLQREGRFNIAQTDINPIRLQIDAGVRDNEIIVDNPTAADLNLAVNKLKLKDATIKPTTNGFFQFTEVYSQQDLNLKVGLNYKGVGFKLDDKFDFSNTNKSRKFFLDFKDITFKTEAFISPQGYFKTAASNEDYDKVYIDKISYGRRIMVFFEDNSSDLNLTNSLAVSASTVDVKVDAALKEQMANTTFKVISYGAKTSFNQIVTGIDNLKATLNKYFIEINNVSNYPEQWGKPITYSLKFLNGDVAIVTANVENVPRRTCVANPNRPMNVSINLLSVRPSGDADLYGNMQVRFFKADGTEISNTSAPSNPSLWDIKEEAHYSSDKPILISNDAPSQNKVQAKIGFEDIQQGAYCRIYAWINDWDGGSGNDYFEIRNRTGNDTYGNYRQFNLADVIQNCNKSANKNDGCDLDYEAAESDGSCNFKLKWLIQ